MAAIAKKIVLITGANSGIGFELAHQLLTKGHHVLVGSRTVEKGKTAVQELQSRNLAGTAELVHLDVTDDSTITAAASTISSAHGKLDILINNAAVAVPSGTDREQLNSAFDTNATGPYILTNALLPSLLKSPSGARVVNVSSGIGSIGRKLDPTGPFHKVSSVPYRASKTALNMVTACQFVELGEMGIKVFLYDPGFTVSNLSEHNTVERGARSAKDSVLPLVDVIEGKRDGECGLFLHNTGTWPW
ncbi:NAD(P)-binding protein [Periconia macrospinosa]|uniref:NAD(P)-binding protein n=1 Tax=Periconia macrospinosa TaxID=97972 RepID=A0A2V1E2I6_9PLEO|nr:NAD(P)-binding protein [Periconia macrospinosa]